MSWSNEKSDRSVEAADPDFGCASIEVEGAFFVDLDRDIRSGKDVYADRRGSGKRGRWISEQPTFLSVGKQDDIGNPDLAVASKNSLLDCGEFACVKAVEEIGNSASSLAAIEARGWGHDKLAGGVDLKTFGPIGECGIGADFEPASGGWIVCKSGHWITCGNSGQSEELGT
jgi:hypothetical protein